MVRLLGYDLEHDTLDPAQDVVSGDLATTDEAIDWASRTAQVDRQHLGMRGREIWVGGACAALAIVESDTATIAQPDPAPDSATMTVGTGDAKEMPPGIAEELAGMSEADRAVAERIGDLGEVEPLAGYEERAVDRARREGLLPPISDKELNRGGLLELRSELARVLSVAPDVPLAELVHAVRIAVIERREAREYGERIRQQLEQARRPTA